MRAFLVSILICSPLTAGVIPLSGTEAGETSGDGYAFNMPDLDGLYVQPNGTVVYNPLTYPPLPFNPQQPETPLPAGTSFNFGTLTYSNAAITGNGVEFLAVTPTMFVFDFSIYSLAMGHEVDVRPPTAGGMKVELANIAGPGLKFSNGTPVSLNFTATVNMTPTLNGFNQTLQPYTGRLAVVNGTFTFAMSDAPRNWPLFGATNVHFFFDLVATVASLAESQAVVIPTLSISTAAGGNVMLTPAFGAATTKRFILQQSTVLDGGWTDLGADFDSASAAPVIQPVTPPARFFRIRSIDP